MAVALTEKAASEVQRKMQDQKMEEDTMLRVAVTGGGCSGLSYALAFDRTYNEAEDSQYDCHGVKVVIDKKSALYLDDTTVDFQDDIHGYGFKFDNPNAVKSCGCGHSFHPS